MNKEQLFEKYNIDESHNVWDNSIDNWMSVEVYRVMHDGQLPPPGDMSILWVLDFLDKTQADVAWFFSLEKRGSLYLTSKRMVYSLAENILKDLTERKEGGQS